MRLVSVVVPLALALLAACSPPVATPEELAAFNAAGPVVPIVDTKRLAGSRVTPGPYRITPGDVLSVDVRAVRVRPPAAEGASKAVHSAHSVEVGDILELRMPAVLKAVGEVYSEEIVPYACRVRKDGTIWLPTAGEMAVAGKALPDIEEAIVAAYYPKFVRKRPAVLARIVERARVASVEAELFTKDAATCRVTDSGAIRLPLGDVAVGTRTIAEAERAVEKAYCPKYVDYPPAVLITVSDYRTSSVMAIGGVAAPGRYRLRGDEMTLVSLLMKAGGITGDGAYSVRIRHADSLDPNDAETFILPMRDGAIPFADVALRENDVVEVERVQRRLFTVLGLARAPGIFPYPQDVKYNLAQAIAIAGGGDPVADPRYISIYRQDADGSLVSARFRMATNSLDDVATMAVRPGDIIFLEHTFRTRTREFFNSFFRSGVFIGATYDFADDNN